MLSYKHAFHAGNHADVIKHLCLISTLEHLKKKNKPFCLYDTHAGAGVYSLRDSEVVKNNEFETGTNKLIDFESNNSIVSQYLDILSQFAADNELPGSPAIGLQCLRECDHQVLIELHPTEYEKLKQNLRSAQLVAHKRNGFEGVVALAPPLQKRGTVLIDPPYERIEEYTEVSTTVFKLYKRWANACVLIWYPLLGKRAGAKSGKSQNMCEDIANKLELNVLDVQLEVNTPSPDAGMYGSGVLVINPPWQLDETVSSVISEVAKPLEAMSHSVYWLNKVD